MTSERETLVNREKINWKRVEEYLRKNISNIPKNKSMKIKKYTEGYSNLTYLIRFGDWEGVLRRPPIGDIPFRAHDMKREYDILEKLNPTFNLAPKPYIYSENNEIMDRHFYVMEKKTGFVLDNKLPDEYLDVKEVGSLISKNMIQTLVQLQTIDYEEVGLSNFGMPNGYLERQINGWIKRYDNAVTDDYPSLPELEAWFIKNRPTANDATIVHNDFKLNNLVFDTEEVGKIIGVLDWELATIGDPLTDFGTTIAYWGEASDLDLGVSVLTDTSDFYSRRDMVEAYANESRRDVTNISYYVAFGFYKLAVILQQIYNRWKIGELKDERFKNSNQAVANLFEMADLTRRNKLL